ncbi:MAG: selenoneine biosynthesis selenosugar synthase SenB [Streptomyces sp.]|uniref:selenoneine biosynthesis selenosugar synthase SenB n=1 Tax=Streptomyces sp. TaxID=1931 RepID=UPI003D6B6C57
MILIITPAGTDNTHGNGVSARRWAEVLRGLGHRVKVADDYRPGAYDALLALHARKSASAVRVFSREHPRAPIVLALTGTDLYPDLATAGVDPAVLDLADRLIVLQPRGMDQLPPALVPRTRVIVQSVPRIPLTPPRPDCFEVAFLAHVRPVKDPLRLIEAVGLLPADSSIRVSHAGASRDPALAAELTAAAAGTGRYDWLGPLPRHQALSVLARSRLLALTSLHEGGANVVSEALAARVPVISTAIPGSIGLLGDNYPGYFPAGDTAALAEILYAAEKDFHGFHRRLCACCMEIAPIVEPERERAAFAELLSDLLPRAARERDSAIT